jgi:hypothetical protein
MILDLKEPETGKTRFKHRSFFYSKTICHVTSTNHRKLKKVKIHIKIHSKICIFPTYTATICQTNYCIRTVRTTNVQLQTYKPITQRNLNVKLTLKKRPA